MDKGQIYDSFAIVYLLYGSAGVRVITAAGGRSYKENSRKVATVDGLRCPGELGGGPKILMDGLGLYFGTDIVEDERTGWLVFFKSLFLSLTKRETPIVSTKYMADGSFSRYKARLVANGSTQLEGIDVDDTFSPVVKPGTIQTVLSLAVSRHWLVHQLDVKNAFLHGDLSKTVYTYQPPVLGLSVTYNPSRTPIDTESKLGVNGDPVSDLTLYQSLTGSLQYLMFTRPDISYTLYNSSHQLHIWLHNSMRIGMVPHYMRRSDLENCVFLGYNLLSWSAKHQPTISRSSAEAKYHGVANAVAEYCWLRNLLRELHTPLSSATLVYCDNARVLHVASCYQFADIFTKDLPSALVEEFRSSLSVRRPPAPTAGEC
ncbi:ribonuclease H-like domain-containing protein [Tanacetum coccineum]